LDLAAVPIPPESLGHVEISGLVFVVDDDVLADVAHDHGQLLGFTLFLEREAVER
jgi:hypothetical protein